MRKRTIPEIPGTHHTGRETHLLREVIRAHQAVVTTFGRSVGAPASRLGLMRLLAIAQGRLGTTELARRLGVHPAAVTRQLKALEAEGLVIRRAAPSDGRRSTVQLTRLGIAAFRGIHDRGHALERSLAPEVTRREVETAVRVLQALRRVVLRAAHLEEEEP